MAEVSMRVVAKPRDAHKRVIAPRRIPVIRGRGHIIYLCGACEVELARNVVPEQLTELIILCPECGAFNEV